MTEKQRRNFWHRVRTGQIKKDPERYPHLRKKAGLVKEAPFVSEAQRRLFYAKERRGEMPRGTAARWEAHTPKGRRLPARVKKEAALYALIKEALLREFIKTSAAAGAPTRMLTDETENELNRFPDVLRADSEKYHRLSGISKDLEEMRKRRKHRADLERAKTRDTEKRQTNQDTMPPVVTEWAPHTWGGGM